MLMSLTFDNPYALIISFLVIIILAADIIAGYKKGFLESGVQFLKSFLAMLVAYFVKTPLSKYFYMNLPFIEVGGIFKGVDAVGILLYEAIAFFVVFILILIVLNILSYILKLEQRVLRIVSIIGVPNKIMGAIVGGLKSLIVLYFALSIFFVAANFMKIDTGKSLGNYVVDIPILKHTLGNVLNSFDKISDLALEYENIQDKENLNNESIDILLEYDIITEENLEILIEAGKVEYVANDIEGQKDMVNDLYDKLIK